MKLLLDTHIALWAITDNPRLSATARDLILNISNEIYFSAATVWEIAIKHRLKRKEMPISGHEAAAFFVEAGYIELPIRATHSAATENLPLHHSDPFDRILVAQAITEPMHLLTHDRTLKLYGDVVKFV